MIAQLTGTVVRSIRNPLILDVHGVGYAVWVPQYMLQTTAPGQIHTVMTHTYVREDALMLYGFASDEELTLFNLLLTVSGIGPKTALAVLDQGSSAIRTAIATADVEFFMAIPRLGKKNAQKIIIELKTKLHSPADLDLSAQESTDAKQITAALIAMGFDKKEAMEAMKKLPLEGTIEQKLKFALKMLG